MATMRCAAGVALLAALVHAEVNLLCGLNSRCKSVEEARRVGFETLEFMKKHSPLEGMPDSNLKQVVERECARVSDKWPSERTPSRRWVCQKRGRIYAEDLMKHDTIKKGEKWSRKHSRELADKLRVGVTLRIENGTVVKSIWHSHSRGSVSGLAVPLQHIQATLAHAAMFGAFDGLTFDLVVKDCDGCGCSPFEGRPAEGFKHFPIATFNKNRDKCDDLKTVPVQQYIHYWSPTRTYPDPPPAWETLKDTAIFRGGIWNEMRAGLTAISALGLVPDTDMASMPPCQASQYVSRWKSSSSAPDWTKKITSSHTQQRSHGSMCRPDRLPWKDQLQQYKYHVSADGYSVAVRFWWTLKAAGVLVSVESEHVDFYEEQIIPFVHFLSVPKNLHDMPESMAEVMAWARSNDNLTHEISKEGNLYYKEHTSPEAQMMSISLYSALLAELWDDSLSNDPQYDLEKSITARKVFNHPEGLNCVSGKHFLTEWQKAGYCAENDWPASIPADLLQHYLPPRQGSSASSPPALPSPTPTEVPPTAPLPATPVTPVTPVTSAATGKPATPAISPTPPVSQVQRSAPVSTAKPFSAPLVLIIFVGGLSVPGALGIQIPRKVAVIVLLLSVAVGMLFWRR